MLALSSVALGVHEYPAPPPAVNDVLAPIQIAGLPLVAVTTIGVTVTVTTSVEEQPFISLPVTVYVVVEAGVAKGFEMAALSNDDAGVHK